MNIVTKLGIGIFCFASAYMFFLTADIPPHWESHLFIEGLFSTSLSESFWSIAKLGDSMPTASHGPVNVLYYKLLFFLFGYNFIFYRLVKSLFFAGTMLFFFHLSNRFIKLKYAIAATGFLMFSFPIFIQTFVFDEGFIIGEFFKMAALYVFFSSFSNISIKKVFVFFVLALFAIRTYTATFSIVGIVAGYLLLKRENVRYYVIPLILLFLLKFPVGSSGYVFGDSSYGFNVEVVERVFFNDAVRFILSPLPKFSDLYYRPYVSVLTFFGFWLLVFFIFIQLFGNYLHMKYPNLFRLLPHGRKDGFLSFFFIWFLCELPILFVLPEHAIRYTAALTAPVGLIFCTFLNRSLDAIKMKTVRNIIILFFISILLINLAYAVFFRATWGSAFIGMEEVSYFIQDNLPTGKKAKIFYYATSAAPEYHVIDVHESDKYTVSKQVIPVVMNLEVMSPEFIEKEKNDEYDMYVVKRITSFGHSEFPAINFEEYENLKRVKVIEGCTNGAFDSTIGRILSFSKYEPNKFYVYQFVDQQKDTVLNEQ